MKCRLYKSHYGNKGVIFTLDALVALIVFLIAFVVSTYYVSQASENKLAQIQMATYASDLLAVMDNNGTLQTLNSTLIENQKNELLPAAYDMRIILETSDSRSVDVGDIAPDGIFVITGKRYLVENQNYVEASYLIWERL